MYEFLFLITFLLANSQEKPTNIYDLQNEIRRKLEKAGLRGKGKNSFSNSKGCENTKVEVFKRTSEDMCCFGDLFCFCGGKFNNGKHVK